MTQVQNKKSLIFATLMLLGVLVPTHPAMAQHAAQTVETVSVDVQKLSTGYRASKVIGSSVINNDNVTIGKIDDLIVSPDDNRSAYVILSVGGWLGMGTHLIALPYSDLSITTTKVVLPGATKDGLKSLPEFKYSVN